MRQTRRNCRRRSRRSRLEGVIGVEAGGAGQNRLEVSQELEGKRRVERE